MKEKLIKTVSRFFHDYTLNEMYMMNRYGPESRLTYRSLPCLAIAACMYFILTFISSRLIALLEKRMKHGRK